MVGSFLATFLLLVVIFVLFQMQKHKHIKNTILRVFLDNSKHAS